jgi:repressor LexA
MAPKPLDGSSTVGLDATPETAPAVVDSPSSAENASEKLPLTDRQRRILDFINASMDERGYPPTLREIGRHMGIRSTNGVNDHLVALERKGYLTRDELKSRALRSVSYDGAELEVPILGHVAAGRPMLAEENVVDRVTIDRHLLGTLRGSEVFGLVVSGDSMIEDGIRDGDYLFVRKQSTAERGQIVVVMVDGEATCKRIYPEGDRIRLQPANSGMRPIYVESSEFRAVDVLGKVVGVYRKVS